MKYNIKSKLNLNGFYSNFEAIYKQLLVMMNDSFNDTSSIDNKTIHAYIDYNTNSIEDIISSIKLIMPIVKSCGTMGMTDRTINRTVMIVYINNHLIIGNQSIMLLNDNKTISYITDKGIKL